MMWQVVNLKYSSQVIEERYLRLIESRINGKRLLNKLVNCYEI